MCSLESSSWLADSWACICRSHPSAISHVVRDNPPVTLAGETGPDLLETVALWTAMIESAVDRVCYHVSSTRGMPKGVAEMNMSASSARALRQKDLAAETASHRARPYPSMG